MPGTLRKRLITAAGNIYAGSGRLHCLIVSNPESTVKYVILNDATSGTGGDVALFYVAATTTKVFNFHGGIWFDTGIRIGTLEHTNMIVTGIYETR